MRLFVALYFDANTVEAICKLQSLLRDNDVEGNYTKPQNLHMTLTFIGEYGNPDDVLDVLETLPFRHISLCFSDVYVHREMVLVSVARNPGLESYVRRLRRALAEKGIPFDRKNFNPHITLVRKAVLKDSLPDNLLKDSGLTTTDADMVSLLQSTQGKNGMIYTELGHISG
ncbi:MAG: RNA 2',3'-cyclic phosphodiesterase [Lachnospiraceae bacterium]|nr:RNA 2',3'-cyclic phosphodiesterase [Lachnospiraceae bacterium]